VGAADLPLALQQLADSVNERGACVCRLETDEELHLNDGTCSTHLYRIVQEAVSNSLRHGEPKSILIRLRSEGNSVVLSIVDDGDGIADLEAMRRGTGISNMKYRAGLVGGTVTVERGPKGGTVVKCTIPKNQ
jgi:signal transduction histidine kinase